jgi:hypothetical protein
VRTSLNPPNPALKPCITALSLFLFPQVLEGVHLVFSRVIPLETNPRQHPLWLLAEQYGATCSEQCTADTTHVVAMTGATEKVRSCHSQQRQPCCSRPRRQPCPAVVLGFRRFFAANVDLQPLLVLVCCAVLCRPCGRASTTSMLSDLPGECLGPASNHLSRTAFCSHTHAAHWSRSCSLTLALVTALAVLYANLSLQSQHFDAHSRAVGATCTAAHMLLSSTFRVLFSFTAGWSAPASCGSVQ